MRVGSVNTRPGRPMIACEPKSAIAFTKAMSAPDRMAGATSGSVTAVAVRQLEAPRICADSSMEASTDSSALAASRYTKGKVWMTVTSTRPDIENTLKVRAGTPSTSRRKRLTSPALGLKRFTKAMAVRYGGVTYAITAVRYTNRLAGAFVRAAAHASGSPMATLSTDVHSPSTSELRRAWT